MSLYACPACQHDSTRVTDSRPAVSGIGVWRRRRCVSCGHAFSTSEGPSESFGGRVTATDRQLARIEAGIAALRQTLKKDGLA